jgi:Family of unknown function (DUF6286)
MTIATRTTEAAPESKPPLAAPSATTASVVMALILIAAGVIVGRDALIGVGVVAGSPWITACLEFLDGLNAQSWMLPAGIATAVVGLVLLVAAVKPRRRTHRATKAPGAWIAPRDIRRISRGALLSLTGVAEATAGGSANTLTLTITPVAGYDASQLDSAVRATLTETLEPLVTPPRIKTRFKERDSS